MLACFSGGCSPDHVCLFIPAQLDVVPTSPPPEWIPLKVAPGQHRVRGKLTGKLLYVTGSCLLQYLLQSLDWNNNLKKLLLCTWWQKLFTDMCHRSLAIFFLTCFILWHCVLKPYFAFLATVLDKIKSQDYSFSPLSLIFLCYSYFWLYIQAPQVLGYVQEKFLVWLQFFSFSLVQFSQQKKSFSAFLM